MSEDITIVTKTTDTPVETHIDNDTAPVAAYLSVVNPADREAGQLKTIVEFLRGDAKEMTQAELLNQLKQIELKLGQPRIGERRLDVVYRYAKLQSEIKNLEGQRNALLR